ncbi:MAG: phage head closure protein [Pseudomonadota bacterium]
MRAGRLDTSIAIQRVSTVLDEAGTPQETVTTIATPRAQVIQSSTEEFMRHGAVDETVTVFRIRWIEGITLADRVQHLGQSYNIKELKPIGRRRGLDLRTVAVA